MSVSFVETNASTNTPAIGHRSLDYAVNIKDTNSIGRTPPYSTVQMRIQDINNQHSLFAENQHRVREVK